MEMQSTMVVGGSDGFVVDLFAGVTLAAGMTRVTLGASHAGGWSPIKGPLESLFATPAFEGAITFGPTSYLWLDFDAYYLAPINIGTSFITIGPHPDLHYPGMHFRVHAFREEGLSLSSPLSRLTVEFAGALQVGKPGTVPSLLMEGLVEWTDAALAPSRVHLDLRSSGKWRPFNVLPFLTLPVVGGSLDLYNDGMVEASMFHEPITINLPGNVVQLKEWQVGIPSLSFSINDVDVQPELELVAHGTIAIDITGTQQPGVGFEANVSGRFVVQTRTLELSISHAGGWRPFQGIDLETPAIQGAMSFSPSGMRVAAAFGMADKLVLLPGILEIGAGAHLPSTSPHHAL